MKNIDFLIEALHFFSFSPPRRPSSHFKFGAARHIFVCCADMPRSYHCPFYGTPPSGGELSFDEAVGLIFDRLTFLEQFFQGRATTLFPQSVTDDLRSFWMCCLAVARNERAQIFFMAKEEALLIARMQTPGVHIHLERLRDVQEVPEDDVTDAMRAHATSHRQSRSWLSVPWDSLPSMVSGEMCVFRRRECPHPPPLPLNGKCLIPHSSLIFVAAEQLKETIHQATIIARKDYDCYFRDILPSAWPPPDINKNKRKHKPVPLITKQAKLDPQTIETTQRGEALNALCIEHGILPTLLKHSPPCLRALLKGFKTRGSHPKYKDRLTLIRYLINLEGPAEDQYAALFAHAGLADAGQEYTSKAVAQFRPKVGPLTCRALFLHFSTQSRSTGRLCPYSAGQSKGKDKGQDIEDVPMACAREFQAQHGQWPSNNSRTAIYYPSQYLFASIKRSEIMSRCRNE